MEFARFLSIFNIGRLMNGLYQRALEVYRQGKGLRLLPKGGEDRGIEDIPAEERENILREIDLLLAKNRVEPSPGRPAGARSGFALPFLVNLLVVAAVAGAIFLYTRYSEGEERAIESGARELRGAEGQLVEALRREQEAELGQKDQAIVEFQRKLADAAAEKQRLESKTAEEIKRREAELQAGMAASLEAERARLRASGLGDAAAGERLRAYEEKLKADAARQAEAFQRQAREEAARNAAAVDQLMADYRRGLDQAQGERTALQQQYQSREAELRSQYARESKALQEEKAKALSDLGRIQEQRRQEELVESRILASYDEVASRIASGRYAGALESVAALRDSLDREPARSLDAVRRRRPVELFILGSLEELIKARIQRDSADASALVDTKARIDALRDKSARADRVYRQRDYQAARDLYLSALSEIPEARASHERLEAMALSEREAAVSAAWKGRLDSELEAQREEQRLERAAALRRASRDLPASGEAAMRDGAWQAALDSYGRALGLVLEDERAAASVVSQVAEAGYRLGAGRDAARLALLPARVESMRRELTAAPAGPAPEAPDVAALLRAKLLLWQVVEAEPVKSKYPGLAESMQAYFDAYGSEERRAGREAALREVLDLTASIRSGGSAAPASAKAAAPDEREALAGILADLEALLNAR